MKKIQLVLVLTLACVLFGYFGCGFALQHGMAVPASLYWFFFLAIPSISLLLVSDNEAYNLVLLILNSVSVYSMYFLQNHTWYPSGRDTQFETQIVSLIFDAGKWVPEMGTSMSREISVHPAMHIFLASLCLVVGIEPYHAIFIVPWLKGVCFTLFFYAFSRKFLSDKKGVFFASVVYMGCLFPMRYPHREVFAEILFMGILWIWLTKKISFSMKMILILFFLSLAMSHHFTSYVFLLLYGVIYLFSKRKREMIHPLLPAVVVLSWISFVSFMVASGYMMSFFKAFEIVLFPTIERRVLAATSYYYSLFENLLILMNPPLIGVLALPSFLSALRNREKTSLLAMTFVLGTLQVLLLLLFIYPTGWGTGAYRAWGFLYIPLSVWAGLSFFEKKRFPKVGLRTITCIVVVMILFASMNLSVLQGIKKWYVPPGYMETYRFSDSMVSTARWCGVHLNGSIIGDNLAYNSVGSWGCKEVYQYSFIQWYRTKDNEILRKFDYIILSPWDPVTYSDTFREPIDPFALLPETLSMVYSSGDLVVYRILSQ